MDLKDLYQDIIIDHNRSPRNFRALDDATHVAEGFNPLCGDKLRVFLKVEDDTITDVTFLGSGCAISTASASLMTDQLKGRPVAEAEQLFGRMHALLTKGEDGDPASLGKLAALSGVRDYPTRVKCATLCWHTLQSALAGDERPATTE